MCRWRAEVLGYWLRSLFYRAALGLSGLRLEGIGSSESDSSHGLEPVYLPGSGRGVRIARSFLAGICESTLGTPTITGPLTNPIFDHFNTTR